MNVYTGKNNEKPLACEVDLPLNISAKMYKICSEDLIMFF